MKLELGNNKQTNLIIQYLLDTSKTDEHLRLAIEKNPDKDFENGCFNYIINQASKFQTNRCAMIEEKQVFDWAFEYYIDYEQIMAKEQEAKTPKISNSSVVVKTSEADTKKAVKSENKADKKAKPIDFDNEVSNAKVEAKRIYDLLKQDKYADLYKTYKTTIFEIRAKLESCVVKKQSDLEKILNTLSEINNSILKVDNKDNKKSEKVEVKETENNDKKEDKPTNKGYVQLSLF